MKVILTEKIYADVNQNKRYPNLETVFKKDDDGKKGELKALCVAEKRYYDSGKTELIEYAVPQKTTVRAAAFRRSEENLLNFRKGKPVYADNYYLVGVCNDVIRLRDASLATAAVELLKIGSPGHIAVHRTTVGEFGLDIGLQQTIHIFMAPFELLNLEQALKLCNKEETETILKLNKQGCQYFSLYENGNFAALNGECYVVSSDVLWGWAGVELPPQQQMIIMPLWPQDGLLS